MTQFVDYHRKFTSLQAALVIRGFVIRGFDYPRLSNCVQNLLFAFGFGIRAIFIFSIHVAQKILDEIYQMSFHHNIVCRNVVCDKDDF